MAGRPVGSLSKSSAIFNHVLGLPRIQALHKPETAWKHLAALCVHAGFSQGAAEAFLSFILRAQMDAGDEGPAQRSNLLHTYTSSNGCFALHLSVHDTGAGIRFVEVGRDEASAAWFAATTADAAALIAAGKMLQEALRRRDQGREA